MSIWVLLTWVVFIAAIVLIVILFVHFAWITKRESAAATSRIDELREVFTAAKSSRIQARQRAQKASGIVGEIWTEYDETLVDDPQTHKTRSTMEAEFFFNPRSLANKMFENRWVLALPGTLIAVGVAGTFFKLTFGLMGLDLRDGADIDVLQESVMTLLNTAGLSFLASGIGVAMSLFATWILSRRQNRIASTISRLASEIDNHFERYSAELGIQSVERNTHEIAESLNELHEKIGIEFQKSVQGLSNDMQNAIIGAINVALGPAVQNLSEAASRQSGEVFDSLVGRFSDAFEGMGQTQATAMRTASQGLVESVSSLSGQIADALGRIEEVTTDNAGATRSSISQMLAAAQEQAKLDRETHSLAVSASRAQAEADRRTHSEVIAQLQTSSMDALARFKAEASEQTNVLQRQLGELAQTANDQQTSIESNIEQLVALTSRTQGMMERSASSLSSSSSDLKSITEGFTATTESVTGKLFDAVSSIESISRQQSLSLQALEQHSTAIGEITSHSTTAGENLAAAAHEAKASFEEMRDHQTEFLLGLGDSLEQAKKNLTNSIEQSSKKMSEWLAAYSDTVSSQTDERLELWNSHSTQYATSMLQIARSLEGVVDELEGVSKSGTHPRKAVLS